MICRFSSILLVTKFLIYTNSLLISVWEADICLNSSLDFDLDMSKVIDKPEYMVVYAAGSWLIISVSQPVHLQATSSHCLWEQTGFRGTAWSRGWTSPQSLWSVSAILIILPWGHWIVPQWDPSPQPSSSSSGPLVQALSVPKWKWVPWSSNTAGRSSSASILIFPVFPLLAHSSWSHTPFFV